MSEWIKTSERLPKLDEDGDSDYVLVFHKGYGILMSVCYYNGCAHGFYDNCNLYSIDDAPYWMPLPEPPKGE